MRRGARLHIRRQAIQRCHIGVEILRGAGGDLGDALAGLARTGVDLVIHVGDVPGVGDMREGAAQQPRQHVEHHHRPGIAQMREIINRRPADIHAHMIGIDWPKRLAHAGEAIVEAELGHEGRSMGPKGSGRKRAFKRLEGR